VSSEILSLFPTPVMFNSMGRSLTEAEIKFINSLERKPNENNSCGTNAYLLDAPEMFPIRESVQKAIDEYKKEVLNPKDEFDIGITTSWVNWTDTNESHHVHKHPNSFLSGVLYISTVVGDSITFYNPVDSHFQIETKAFSNLNAAVFDANVNTGDIAIFPSTLEHKVKTRKAVGGTRISIAFNTYPKGFIGCDQLKTGVTL
jgi:uncharacterized protein (TIGR02466 family)